MANINISGQLHSTVEIQGDALHSHVVAGAEDILDESLEAKQSDINGSFENRIHSLEGSSVSYSDQEPTQAEQEQARENLGVYSKERVDQIATAFTEQNYVSVQAVSTTTAANFVTLINATGHGEQTDTIYRVGFFDGTAYDVTKYSEYTWNGTAYVQMDVRSSVGEVYDISANHPDGQGNPAVYTGITNALGTNGNNVPDDIRHGGMSVKFIQVIPAKYSVAVTETATQPTGTALSSASSVTSGTYEAAALTDFSTLPSATGQANAVVYYYDNSGTYTVWTITMSSAQGSEYVQYRLMATAWSTTPANWQGVDAEPTAGSRNLVESGGVKKEISQLGDEIHDITDILDIMPEGGATTTLVDTAEGITDIVNDSMYLVNIDPVRVDTNVNFKTTDPIQLHSGDVLTVQAASTTNSTRYAEFHPLNDTYTKIKAGQSSSASDVITDTYTAERDILVAVCFRSASNAIITLTTTGSGNKTSKRIDDIEDELFTLDERLSTVEENTSDVDEIRIDVDAISKEWFGGEFNYEYGKITSSGENNPSFTQKGMRSVTPIYLEKGTVIKWVDGVIFSVFRYENNNISSFIDRAVQLTSPYLIENPNYYRVECDKADGTAITSEEFENIKAAISFTGNKQRFEAVENETYESATIFQRFTDFIPKIICIGDSLTAGHVFLDGTNFTDTSKISYPGFLAKLSGCDVYALASNGITTSQWLERCMPYCDFSQYNCCIMKLGHNANMKGTYEDDVAAFLPNAYEEGYYYNSNMYSDCAHTAQIVGVEGTYYLSLDTGNYYKYSNGEYYPVYDDYLVGAEHQVGAYCRIIEMIKEQNPNIILFLANYQDWTGPSTAAQKVSQISGIYYLPLIDELDHTFINLASPEFHTATDSVHSNIFGYYTIALFYYREIGKYLRNNITKSAKSVSRGNFTENLCTDLYQSLPSS